MAKKSGLGKGLNALFVDTLEDESEVLSNVEEKIEEVMEKLSIHGQASLFFLLKDSEDKAELVATFMGILELIKLRRIFICQSRPDEEYATKPLDFDEEYEEEDWMTLKFEINQDYVPENNEESESQQNDAE